MKVVRETVECANIKAHLLESEAAQYSSLLPAAVRSRAKLPDPEPLPDKCWAEFRQLAKLRQPGLG